MKLVLMLYLEEDEACVERFARESGVPVLSRLSVEGIEADAAAVAGSWYGAPMPFASRMAFAILPDDRAAELLAGIAEGRGGLDARNHPVRAFQLPIESVAACGIDSRPE